MSDRFHQDIFSAPFDVTRKGEVFSIPLKYKFRTCYSLALAVPDKNLYYGTPVGPGTLRYRFVSKGQIIAEGLTFPPARRHFARYREVTLINILVFDLPFPGAGNDLSLELTVETPMTFLNEYSGKINCSIRPNYSAKAGRCYDEELKIAY
jgi:hypothetical protein